VSGPLVIGPDDPGVAELAHALGGTRAVVPVVRAVPDDPGWRWSEPLEVWRSEVAGGDPAPAVVVAGPAPAVAPHPLAELTADEWAQRAETALAVWVAALGAGKARTADGGALVAVLDRPAPLDSGGWAAESGVADAVEALVRSLARSEGPRGVRVNAVSTPLRVTAPEVVDPAPPLRSFPGRLDREVAGAVRLLLAEDAAGVTGTVVHADCGRSWR
jgi:NAD(P)-dependent dehydrogenase (short-subunit alcohol dehydrogenase family)